MRHSGAVTFLDPLSKWPCEPPPGYEGQLDPEFQRRRAALYRGVTPEECDWYHTTQLPDGPLIQGEWDLRGREAAYLGGVEIESRRVLEIGPASGYLTFWLESRGARVTSFEAGYDASLEVIPSADRALSDTYAAALMEHTRRTTNAWWLLHRMTRSSARIVHGDICRLPNDLGEYDLVVLGCVLVHTRDPFSALASITRHASRTVVIVEQMPPALDPDDPALRFNPDRANQGPSVMWWEFSPAAISNMLDKLGFRTNGLLEHCQKHNGRDRKLRPLEVPMYTLVADRV
jgi:SAM-dependent methyltransferase